MKNFIEDLKNPPKEYRPVPFWSWNDKLEPEMLRWQIGEMEKAGLGGYFMHARGGLQTEYMSKEWMDCTRTCIEEGKKLGMNSWCYDEEGWPSGFAGGIVTAMGEKYHMRWIELEEAAYGSLSPDADIIGLYLYDVGENRLRRIQAYDIQVELEPGIKLLVIRQKTNPYYIDILNKEVVRAFIDVTHEKYYKVFADEFGKGMRGFFTDEPQFAREHIPYSEVLPEEFWNSCGYDIVDMLPALFMECEGYEKFRYDYWALVNRLYVESFGKQIYDWCEEHNCMLTGHSIQENPFLWQMYCCAGVMPFYEYMHIPGMDWLCRQIDSPVVPKQVSSVANQLGRKFVLSETFALCGWDISFEELKWIAEWQYVNGVNFLCQHLEGYTLRGLRKRDYPPSLFIQQPWWEEYRLFNDYFSRLGMILTSGRNVSDVLLLHSMKSAWIAYNFKNNETLDKLDKDFVWATETLSGLHIAHEYGDETIIGKYGKVQGDRFIVGQCEYKTIVLPSMSTIDSITMDLLKKFIANGGKIISIGDFPTMCDGKYDDRVQDLKNKVLFAKDKRDLYKLFEEMSIVNMSIADGNGEVSSIHYQQRDLGDYQIFYMVNLNDKETFETTISIKGSGMASRLAVEDLVTEELECSVEDDRTRLKLQFLPMQSHVIVFEKGIKEPNKKTKQETQIIKPSSEWCIEDVDLNALTLDYCSYMIDDTEWTGPIHTINLMDLLLGLKRECNIALKFNFEVNANLEKLNEMFLAIETAEEFDIEINGETLKYTDAGWWRDTSFKKVDIRSLVRNGTNEVILKRKFYQSQKVYDVLFGENVLESERNKLTYDVELESIYVVGDFGVESKSGYSYGERKAVFTDGPFVIVDKPERVCSGDVTEQGYCFFAGGMKLSQDMMISKNENTRYELVFEKPDAVISKVLVNDKVVKTLPWAPFSLDITDFVQMGNNKLSIQLFSGNRNLLGPHHHKDGELYAVGPASFTSQAGWEGDTGETIWRDRYCFVRFGMK